ncbi:MAG: hypothetical protein ABFS86_20680, partial [Planctomycetota bacterium]
MTGDLDLNSRLVGDALWKHFGDKDHEKLRIVEKTFPHRMRADLQRALESLLGADWKPASFSGGAQHAA